MQEEERFELNGSVEQIVFRNEKNGYTVLELGTGEEMITVVGSLPWVSVGEELRVIGSWCSHPTFGEQFKAQAFERSRPATAAAILRYLSSGAIKGIGAATAKKIVDMFGEDTLQVIENEPQRLGQIKGITKSKALKIGEEYQKIYGMREVILYLTAFGISPEETVRIWKKYGAQAKDMLEEDPYCFCEDDVGIDFFRADSIAASMDCLQDNRCRLRAGILYVLRHNLNNGHTCLPAEKMIPVAAKMLGVDLEVIQEVLEELKQDRSVISTVFDGKEYIFTVALYEAETEIAARLTMLLRYPAQSIVSVEESITRIEQKQEIHYAQKQRDAIRMALEKGILILTGGPGTGKTTALNAIISILKEQGQTVLLAAPTGRAAKRMSEVTGEEAKTIHRLLQVEWDEKDHPVFAKNERNLLECDALVVDELSMVDVPLFNGLLRALPLGCRLIMVGDCNQLPSVGSGNVLNDLICSGLFPVVQLDEIFRQAMESLIVTNSHRIVRGEMPVLSSKKQDFFFLSGNEATKVQNTVVDLYTRRLPAGCNYSPLQDIQILCPGRKGDLGTTELNQRLQDVINPKQPGKPEISYNGQVFREGDKVMQIKNNYDLIWTKADGTSGEGVFNGDIGILLSIDRQASVFIVQMEDRFVSYSFDNINEIELAYAITVHKSQGSEFQAVIIPVFQCAPQLTYRNLFYTAVTRAKSILILVGEERTIASMVENNRKTKRYTGLLQFLHEGIEGCSG